MDNSDTIFGPIYYASELNEVLKTRLCFFEPENCAYQLLDYFRIRIEDFKTHNLLDGLLVKIIFNKLIYASFIKNNLLLVSHHNRLKDMFTFTLEGKTNLAIANCSCIMIKKDGDNYNYNVLFSGYPDKTNSCVQKGGGDYCYLSESNTGNVIINNESLRYYLNQGNRKIYIVRHGNALHNKPCNIKIKDSPLTSLGMKQAELLGQAILHSNFDSMNYITGTNIYPLQPLHEAIIKNNITVVTSELKRAQHTTLTILNEFVKKDVGITVVKKMYDEKAKSKFIQCHDKETINSKIKELQPNSLQLGGYKKKSKKRRQYKKHRKSSKRKLLKRKKTKRSKKIRKL